MDQTEAGLRRREFIERTAYAAGLAGMASMLPLSTLLQEAARAQVTPLPSPQNLPIDHFVVICMENRSFDHYFGWLGDVANAVQNMTYVDNSTAGDGAATGQPVSTIHFKDLVGSSDYQGCGHPDPGHGWTSGRRQMQDGFLASGSGNDIFALTYFNEDDLGFIHAAGKAFTVFDNFHCSTLTSTWPNRYYKWSAQSGGIMNNNPPVATLGNQWETIFDRALANNRADVPGPGLLTARYYNSDLPFSAVWGPRAIPWSRPLAEYFADAAAGTLPNITFIDPPFRDGGGFDGNSADEHPHGDVRLGQAWMADVVHAFMNSPNYRRGALFVVYDEWGGFFDHVTPLPKAPDNRASADLNQDFRQMGFRIPAVCVSPYARNTTGLKARVRTAPQALGFESILKLISYRFGLGTLKLGAPGSVGPDNIRHRDAFNIGELLDFSQDPNADPPDLPDPLYVASRPCEMGGGDVIQDDGAHASDLADLAQLADDFGFRVGDGKPSDIFSEPDSIRRALGAAG